MSKDTADKKPLFNLPVIIGANDGWVTLTFQDQLVASTVRLPPAAADVLSNNIGGQLAKAATEARRQKMGLVVAGGDADTPRDIRLPKN